MPVIFEAPYALAVSGYELWVAVAGGADWGGCDVYVSTDNTNFKLQGRAGRSRHGVLSVALPTGTAIPGTDSVNTCSVDLTASLGDLESGTAGDLANLVTLCYVNGEFIAYETATLTAANKYDLTILKRGAYGSPIAAPAAIGAKFARCDAALFKFAFLPSMIGNTLYFKFPAFNTYGGEQQDLASISSVSHVIGSPLGVPVSAGASQSTPSDPAGIGNTSGLMAGLAGAITPVSTGRICVTISGSLSNDTAAAGNGAAVQIRYGTGSAPANAAALAGTAVGGKVSSVLERATANDLQPFSIQAIVTGLTIGTAYWLDLSLAAIVAGNGLAKNISITAFEL
jgi:hypothetical protein